MGQPVPCRRRRHRRLHRRLHQHQHQHQQQHQQHQHQQQHRLQQDQLYRMIINKTCYAINVGMLLVLTEK